MPEKKTMQRARRDKSAGKAATTQAGNFVHEEMDHAKEGKHPVKNRKQAIAIGLSKARRAGVKVGGPKRATAKSRATKKRAADTTKRATSKRSTSATTKRKSTSSKRRAATGAKRRGTTGTKRRSTTSAKRRGTGTKRATTARTRTTKSATTSKRRSTARTTMKRRATAGKRVIKSAIKKVIARAIETITHPTMAK